MKLGLSLAFCGFAIGVVGFGLKTKRVPLEPAPAIGNDQLNLTGVLWNSNEDSLILLRDKMWMKVDLRAATQANRWFQYEIKPSPGNSFTFSDFHAGSPDENSLLGFVEVSLLTTQYASFQYKHTGEAWHSHGQKVNPPGPLHVGFYRSQGHYAGDNRLFLSSYLFVLPDRRVDGRFGVEIFYNAGFRTQWEWHPLGVLPYGPSLLGVCILLFCIPLPMRPLKITIIALAAFGLHAFSCMIIWAAVRYGEAWSGAGGGERGYATIYTKCGCLIIGILAVIKYAIPRKARQTHDKSSS